MSVEEQTYDIEMLIPVDIGFQLLILPILHRLSTLHGVRRFDIEVASHERITAL